MESVFLLASAKVGSTDGTVGERWLRSPLLNVFSGRDATFCLEFERLGTGSGLFIFFAPSEETIMVGVCGLLCSMVVGVVFLTRLSV